MKSFLATILLNILLISNGMLTAVIDVCCLNENITVTQNDNCCSNHAQPKPKKCCDIPLDKDEEIDTHDRCEYDFWYYYTPKFIEEKSPHNNCSYSAFLGFSEWPNHTNLPFESLIKSFDRNYYHTPPIPGRKILEYNCVWII